MAVLYALDRGAVDQILGRSPSVSTNIRIFGQYKGFPVTIVSETGLRPSRLYHAVRQIGAYASPERL